MNNEGSKAGKFRFTGWHMFGCMFAFFGTIIAVNVTMAMLASGTWTGLVVKNSYIASQGFNQELKTAKLQRASGLLSEISHSDRGLSFRIVDRNGAFVKPRDAVVWIGRPAFEQKDQVLDVVCKANGVCYSEIDLAPGIWAMRIRALVHGDEYRRDARLLVGTDGKVQVE